MVPLWQFASTFDPAWLAWAGVASLMITGLLGSVLPALPGVPLVLVGVVWGAWLDRFERVPIWVVALCGVLALLAVLTDQVAALLGARRVRASPWAIAGAALGTAAGVFTGLLGLLFMPLVGAMAGEWWATSGKGPTGTVAAGRRALEVGLATWIGLMVGAAVKLALVFAMVGTFIVAYVW
jgi:uncharacterized protein YqgC (DUF456 family)